MDNFIINVTPIATSLEWWGLLAVALVSYLIGNISFSRIIVGRAVVEQGSKNPGTTNAFRTGGAKKALAVGIMDAFKAFLPALLALIIFGRFAMYIAGFFVVFGHIYPILYNLKGGKGMASTLGFFVVAQPVFAFVVIIVFALIVYLTRLSSIGTLGSTTTLIIYELIFVSLVYSNLQTLDTYGCNLTCQRILATIILSALLALLLYTHRSNIKRLLTGKENKLTRKQTKVDRLAE
ncbi:MAG: glycerol-3-phosphate 1-O-acyltransferase PlsY [Firmicutes bacterium]|nr:glycerol-3-phosphate 1-O-acyltransferase PlsY [Bacillota bacterium]